MISFLFDACALARRYFADVGTANVDQVCRYRDSRVVIPNLAYAETTSAIIAAHNGGLLDEEGLEDALDLLDSDILSARFTQIQVDDRHIADGATLLRRHKVVPRGQIGTGKARMGGADAVYLAVALGMARRARQTGERVILVTSDRALYRAAVDEPQLEAFHFWTCQCSSCGRVRIPEKGRPNVCSACGAVCRPCALDNCTSTFTVRF